MAKVTLKKVLEEVKALTADEQKQLRAALDRLLASSRGETVDDRLQQQLYEAGLLSEIKPPITDLSPYRDRKPVQVKGKPISEVIIEERR